jgi:hypothetical protein
LISAKLVEAHMLVPTGTGDFFAFVLVPDQRGPLMNAFYEHHKDSIR